MLLVNLPLGINAKLLSMDENKIADAISCLKDENEDSQFGYATLKRQFQELAPCWAFLPSRKLLSLIWKCALENESPTLESIQELK